VDQSINAVYLYYGILEAYETVGQELIGPNVLQDQVIPRMKYYVKSFVPSVYQNIPEEKVEEVLKKFLEDLKSRVQAQNTSEISLEDIWELRAAIFGYENAFLEILGDSVIKNYVLKRISDILTVYLPEAFTSESKSLAEKLKLFENYLKSNEFVKYANFAINKDKVRFNVNHCTFARIHDSEAYLEQKTRFCPWGMITQAIVNSHSDEEYPMIASLFTTRGTVTKLEVLNSEE
jgi:hypothetical protein